MKKILKFLLIKNTPDCAPSHGYPQPAVFNRIARRFPEIVNDRKTSVEVALEENDPRLEEILGFLEHDLKLKGVRTYSAHQKANQSDDTWFRIDTKYLFDEQDIEDAVFLRPSFDVSMGLEGLAGTDTWGIVQAVRKLPLLGYVGSIQACTASARKELESQNFVGLDFLPIAVHDSRYHKDDFWQLWANRTMPKVAMQICDLKGDSVQEDYSTGCLQDEILVNQRVLKYRASDLEAMSGTDFAVTIEKWGSPKSRVRREELVVSQRVRQWCVKKRLKAKWTPVLVLPDKMQKKCQA